MAGWWDALVGATQGASDVVQKNVEQRRKLQQLQAEQYYKQQYSPEAQAQQQAMELINRIAPIPTQAPELRMAPTATPEQRSRMQELLGQRQQDFQSSQQNAMKQRLLLQQKFGLLGKTPLSVEDIYARSKAASEGSGAQAQRSYEFHGKAIDQYQKPVDERLDRLSRLQDTMDQQTPQADSLLAPELLTVMAGGQGSGLRMNEAEIARIVGGRSNWESMKAAVNKWKGAGHALSVTPAQRQQMRDLVNTVQTKLQKKSEILNNARQQLIDANDPEEHRSIVFQMRKALQDVDTASAESEKQTSNGVKYTISR